MTIPAASLRSLMTELIDYAGLFPPANLPLEQAIANYARYRQAAEAWMLAHFIIPVGRLEELTAEQIEEDDPFTFSVLGRGGSDSESWLTNLQADIATIDAFLDKHLTRATADMLEVRLPTEILREGSAEELKIMLDQAYDLLDQTPYYEVPFEEGWAEMVKTAVTGIRMHYGVAGFKLRCGGVTAEQFPSVQQVAYAIKLCLDNGIALKCTAGLHHPVRHFNETVNTKMHGFLNVFGAGVLAEHFDLSLRDIEKIIAEEDPQQFVFDDDGFRYQNWHIALEAIETAREDSLISFGSCSFDEPREDLRMLKLLP
ncbi:MAG: hypothetical protein KDE51_08350 [Anaerolineales bacterium]|nr:hypothetical protein [Anaerolineales bacterium]